MQDIIDISTVEEMLGRQEKTALREILVRLEGADIAELLSEAEKDALEARLGR